MTLTFLTPAFLWLLAALPLVVALHFLRSRRRRVDVSAMFLWQRARTTMARRRVFTPTWLLIAQLLFTALAAFALARPALVPTAVPDRVVIIDASASMAAVEGASTRFELAREAAQPLVDGAGRVALIRAGLDARLEAPLDATALERLAVLDALRPGDAAADMGRALALAQALLPDADVHIVSDQDLAVGRAEVHRVGSEAQNVGISALDVGIGQVFVAVVASGSRPVEVEVGLYRDDQPLAAGTVLVPSDGAGSITFPLDDLGGIIEARLTAPPGDALALDDVAFTGSRAVTVVTDDDHGALTRALEAVPNTEVRYSVGARLVEADLKVLTRGFVGEQAPGNYLIFAPPAAEPEFQIVRDWDRAHPLLRFVDLRDLVVGLDPQGQPLTEGEGWHVLARTADLTPVLRVRETGGVWELEAAFHPGQTDLVLRPAFPALVTNVVSQIRTTTRVRLGEGLPGGVTAVAADGDVGQGVLLEPGVFHSTSVDGSRPGGEVVLASLLSPAESRLALVGTAVVSIAGSGEGSPATTPGATDAQTASEEVNDTLETERGDRARSSGAFTTAAYVLVGLALAALVAEWLMFSGVRVPFTRRDTRRDARLAEYTHGVARVDLSLPLVTALVLAMGLATLNSAAPGSEFSRQVAFLVGGFVLCGALVWLGKKRLVRFAPYLYVLSLALLLLTRVMGTVVNGAKSWLILGPLPGFQPSELAKLALILALAVMLHERPIRGVLDYLKVGAIVLPPVALVFDEPDLGSALVLAALAAGIVLIRGIPWRQLVLIVLVVAVAVPTLVLPNLADHQRVRLVSFLNPAADPQGSGYQVIQSTIAVGSGGLLGKGYRQGTQTQLGFVPYRQTDFIFPVLAEEGGFVASVTLLILYGLLFWRLVAMASECPYERDQLIIVGVCVLIGFQVLVNVGVTLGMAPVTGITLPLVSYGGTSLVSTLMALAVAFVVHRDRYADW